MTLRQIVLDTETTGLRWKDGHRIIEIGCIEIANRRMTDNHFHYYFNPQRDIDAGAEKVHGISLDFLADKPLISEKIDDFISFVSGAELIIHNASFDIGFLDAELTRANQDYGSDYKKMHDYCRITDSLQLAREKHSGRNSLDALCQRYEVDSSGRQLHGALLDARLLAEVYLKMTSGQKKLLMRDKESSPEDVANNELLSAGGLQLEVQLASSSELDSHQEYMQFLEAKGCCRWVESSQEVEA